MTDFAAEGLLDGLEGEARQAREALLRELLDDGVPLDELKRACAEDRLVLLPVERALALEPKYTPRELSEKTGVAIDDLRQSRAAFGLPTYGDDERMVTDADLAVTGSGLQALLDAGVPLDRILELNRVIGRAMMQVASTSRAMVAEALFQPGLTERDVATMAAAAARELAPRMAPVLAYVYEGQLREVLRSDVLSAADVAAGRTGAARHRSVAFADLVGFTRLGEQLEPEELGAVARRLEEFAGQVVCPPATLVKTVGDAVMLVSPDTDHLLETSLQLIAAADDEGESYPQLRVGIARGPALERAGDWYGSPVNQASRVTGVARAGSVLATGPVKSDAGDGWNWSYAGERRLRGVGPTRLYRARRAESDRG